MDNINMVKIKKIAKIILSMILLITLLYNVSAFGVSSPYWDENPLYVKQGEVKEVTMVLQNMVGGEDLTVIAELNGGKEIATLLDKSTTYIVPLGVNSVPVKLKITVPSDAGPGQEWQVGVSFKTVAPDTGGLSIGTGISKGFKVIVKEPEKTPTSEVTKALLSSQTLTFLVSLAVLIILLLIIKHFHKKRENQ